MCGHHERFGGLHQPQTVARNSRHRAEHCHFSRKPNVSVCANAVSSYCVIHRDPSHSPHEARCARLPNSPTRVHGFFHGFGSRVTRGSDTLGLQRQRTCACRSAGRITAHRARPRASESCATHRSDRLWRPWRRQSRRSHRRRRQRGRTLRRRSRCA